MLPAKSTILILFTAFSLTLFQSGCSESPSPSPDGPALHQDAGPSADSTPGFDGAPPTDSATPTDSSTPGDSATPADSSTPGDSATPADSSTPGDSATPADSGAPAGDATVDYGPLPTGLILFDGFDYEARRDDVNVRTVFQNNGPWSYAKTDQDPNHTGGAGGWLYTVESIPGYTGTFPGRNSTRVLCVESGAGTYAPITFGQVRQTDFYLQYGDPSGGDLETVPGNVWFQFWIYVNDYGSQQSTFGNSDKWIYPTRNGYPSTELHWLFSANNAVYNPNDYAQGNEGFHELALSERAWGARASISTPLIQEWNQGKIGQNVSPQTIITPNQWWLVKFHANTSGQGSNTFEVWVRPRNGAWVKVSSYIEGVTTSPELPGTLTWNLEHAAGGHRGFRFPTTMNGDVDNPVNGDSWTYVDDFAMAHTEADLPTYSN